MSSKIYDYVSICSSILSLDPKIRFAGIINEHGRLVAGGMKENVEPLETEKDDELIFMELALRVKMRKEFDKQLGLVNFAMASRKRALAISVIIMMIFYMSYLNLILTIVHYLNKFWI